MYKTCVKTCVCGYSSIKRHTFIYHQKFCIVMENAKNDQLTQKKTQLFAGELFINPTPNPDALSRLCKVRGIEMSNLKKHLNMKAELLVANRGPIQKPQDNTRDLKEFKKRIRNDVKAVGSDGEVGFLEQLVEGFTSLTSIKNERVFKYMTNDTLDSLNLKITYLLYCLSVLPGITLFTQLLLVSM